MFFGSKNVVFLGLKLMDYFSVGRQDTTVKLVLGKPLIGQSISTRLLYRVDKLESVQVHKHVLVELKA